MLLRAFARKGGVSITRPWLQPSSVLRSSPSLFITANNNSNCNGNLGNLSSIRGKHSATQIKRIFRNHPARLRVEERMGIEHSYLPLHPIQFPRIYEPPVVLPNGWSTPLPVEERPHYPFTVQRTKNKPMDAIGFLPVYTKHRKDGTKVVTRVKKVKGDTALFLRELRSTLNLPEPANGLASYDSIRIRTGGTIEMKGNRAGEVRDWLAGLGF